MVKTRTVTNGFDVGCHDYGDACDFSYLPSGSDVPIGTACVYVAFSSNPVLCWNATKSVAKAVDIALCMKLPELSGMARQRYRDMDAMMAGMRMVKESMIDAAEILAIQPTEP